MLICSQTRRAVATGTPVSFTVSGALSYHNGTPYIDNGTPANGRPVYAYDSGSTAKGFIVWSGTQWTLKYNLADSPNALGPSTTYPDGGAWNNGVVVTANY